MRLFIACPVPEEIKKKIADLENVFRNSNTDVKWVRPESIHLTLKFLGEVSEHKIPEINNKISKAIEGFSVFHVAIEKIGVFPDWRRIRVVWVGIEDGKKELKELSKRVEDKMANIGFKKEKRGFTAHITIGRVRSGRGIDRLTDAIRKKSDASLGDIQIGEVLLMQSMLRPEGATYKCLERFSLDRGCESGSL